MLFYNNLLKYNLNFITNYCDNITDNYIETIQHDKYNNTIFHCIDNKKNEYNITSFLTYRRMIKDNEIKIIILIIGVDKNIRYFGYGKIILDEFIKLLKKKNKNKKDINIYIHSLESSKDFFINYGFEKIDKCNFLQNYEGWSNEENEEKLLFKLKI